MSGLTEREWLVYLEEGEKFLSTAVGGHAKRPDIFTPEIVYNIAAMSIEKLFMSLLMAHGRLPDNHTLRDLTDAVRLLPNADEALLDEVASLDRFQEICCIDLYHRDIPASSDVGIFLSAAGKTRNYVMSRLPNPPTRNPS